MLDSPSCKFFFSRAYECDQMYGGMGRDNPRINYSTQYLVDFTKTDLRSIERYGSHFCYIYLVEETLNHVRKHEIENEEAHLVAQTLCKADVPSKSSSNLGFCCMHTRNILGAGEENGEKFIWLS